MFVVTFFFGSGPPKIKVEIIPNSKIFNTKFDVPKLVPDVHLRPPKSTFEWQLQAGEITYQIYPANGGTSISP